ncbi:MAG TPA: TIGR03435 family protein [Bryobacteraceae bacterium]|jgi:uncharacterized protein (TIGR03435 family)|nr:TIGR03435 family protein [Bryobacteraceae bacterium]
MLRVACGFGLAVCGVFGQALPSFEVASIRPYERVNQMGHGLTNISGPRVTMTGYTVSGLIQYAYDMRNYQVSGGPNWITSDTYSVTAKVEGDASAPVAEIRKMVQSLLAERFELKLHRDTKEEKVYLLESAKTGGTLKPSIAEKTTMQMGAGHLMMAKVTTPVIAAMLASVLGRPVLDRTGMTGEFDFTLDSPDVNMGRPQPQDENPGPSLFTALQEQLGLKLEPSRGPVEILVVDHIGKPAEN